MVQQMIDAKFNEYGLANSGTSLPTCDRQPPISIKKTPLRDLQNETRNISSKPHNNSPLSKGKGLPVDDVKVCGSKRPIPDCPPSPTCNSSPCNNGSNSHLVYVRRKAESEPGKTNASNIENENPPQAIKVTTVNEHEPPKLECKMQDFKFSQLPTFTNIPAASLPPFLSGEPSAPHSLGKPGNGFPSGGSWMPHTFGKTVNGLTVSEPNYSTVTTGMPFLVTPKSQKMHIQQRQERFDQLQARLKSSDNSNQDEYIRTLRSLSAADRSKHAIELEKRAIYLSLEEGKQFQRVMSLNVLGKPLPKDDASTAAQSQF